MSIRPTIAQSATSSTIPPGRLNTRSTEQTSHFRRIEAERPQTKKKFDGTCRYCAIYGHKWAECRKRQRDEAAGYNNSQAHKTSEQQTNTQTESQPKFNAKLVCQSCGYLGHSAKDCRYRFPHTSAKGSIPYNKQSTSENRDFRRDFGRAQNGHPQPTKSTITHLRINKQR